MLGKEKGGGDTEILKRKREDRAATRQERREEGENRIVLSW